MSKYSALWDYIGKLNKDKAVLTFQEIEKITGVPVDHSFLRYKKELTKYGYKVGRISMTEQKITFERLPSSTLVLYIHGKGGTADEAEHYKPLFPECDVVGIDYKAETPWEAKTELSAAFSSLSAQYEHIILIANSIGAYFAMCAIPQERIEKAYFISPIVNMERLIYSMMKCAKVSEADLREKKVIETSFGETLSWEYLSYARNHPICWEVPTKILYGEMDNLTDRETVSAFTDLHNARLTVMENGEHWFHTPSQMEFLDNWIIDSESSERKDKK